VTGGAARVIDLDLTRNRTCNVWDVWVEGIRPGRCMPVAKRRKICLLRARNRFGEIYKLTISSPDLAAYFSLEERTAKGGRRR
jgi:hypothetical protein